MLKKQLKKLLIKTASIFLSISALSFGMEVIEQQTKTENPYLFELTNKNAPNKVDGYILGTMHNLSIDIFSDPVKFIINSAETIFVEVTSKGGMTLSELEELGAFWEESNLFINELTEKENSLLHSIFSDAMHRIKPWCVYLLLTQLKLVEMYKSQNCFNNGMDAQLQTAASASMKSLIGLETEKERFCAFGFLNMSDEDAIKNIKNVLKDWETENPKISSERAIESYLYGSLEGLKTIENSNLNYCTKESLNARDSVMYENFLKYLSTKENTLNYPFLIAVGYAHLLLGENGLLKNISTNYNIRRVHNDGTVGELMTF